MKEANINRTVITHKIGVIVIVYRVATERCRRDILLSYNKLETVYQKR